jgi:hypothetical protein
VRKILSGVRKCIKIGHTTHILKVDILYPIQDVFFMFSAL